MESEIRTILRHDLYEQIWETPITRLARQYGISDVGLAKICRKYDIPRPPRGYWARKSSGVKVGKTPLPNKAWNSKITIKSNPCHGIVESQNIVLKKLLPSNERDLIKVAKRLSSPHPLIERSAAILGRATPNEKGLIAIRAKKCLNIRVSEKILPRALRIMDAFIKNLNKLNYDVSVSDDQTIANIDGIQLKFGIREKLEIKKTPLEPKDQWYDFRTSEYRQEFLPTGRLCISVDDFYLSGGLQRNWQDSPHRQLEDQLGKMIAGFIKLALKEQEDNRKREEERRLRQEMIARQEAEKRRRKEMQKIIDLELNRVSGLIEDAENWKKSKLIMEFVSAAEQKHLIGECCYKPGCDWTEWIQWAKEQAQRLDPLTHSPPSIIDESTGEK